jgi:DNA processing protein
MSTLTHQIALSLFPRIGAVNARRLVAYLGSLNAVFETNKKDLKDIPGIGEGLIKTLIESREEILERAEKEIEFILKYKLKTFFYLDKNFPRRLAQCDDAPVILFMKGDVDLNTARIISIVGTRSATDYGREMTENLIADLAAKGQNTVVVSGLAYGIDVAAHKASIKNNLPTIGVIGHGLDKMYPASHASVAREMLANNGALLTDFTSETKIDPGNFLRRNRIIAGLADCTIVIESASKGGALVTADIANSYNRDVFAFPGRSCDPYSRGCNDLIKQNKAALIETADDLMNYMGWEAELEPRQQTLMLDLSPIEKNIVDILKSNEITTIDMMALAINEPISKINATLLNLEFKGAIKGLPGNRYKLLSKFI